MPSPLHKEQLDAAADRGCANPGCSHDDHDKVIWMHQRCHTGAPRFMHRHGDVVSMICALPDCGNSLIMQVHATGVDLHNGSRFRDARHKASQTRLELLEGADNGCCDTSAVSAFYVQGSGKLEVVCYSCENRLATVSVASMPSRV